VTRVSELISLLGFAQLQERPHHAELAVDIDAMRANSRQRHCLSRRGSCHHIDEDVEPTMKPIVEEMAEVRRSPRSCAYRRTPLDEARALRRDDRHGAQRDASIAISLKSKTGDWRRGFAI
jgi:hypothetical protein